MSVPPKGLLVAAPMRFEASLISKAAPGLAVRRTGIGPRRSRRAAVYLQSSAPSMLVVMGFAGGLEQDSGAGEVVVAQELRGPRGERVRCAGAALLEAALLESGVDVRRGVIACVRRPALGRARARLREEGAIAADMESLWLAQGALGDAFGVVRVIADGPGGAIWRPARGLARFRDARAGLTAAASALGRWERGVRSYRVGDALGFEQPPDPRGGLRPGGG